MNSFECPVHHFLCAVGTIRPGSQDSPRVNFIICHYNRRIKKDIKSGMFVALLYAVLDAEDGSVGLCSAGQTQPLLLSAKTAEATLVETVGDTFPLGILDEANY
ncbi:MAG: SpoIIE family protein phosphatase, partial [Candidatus Bathyarchaeota archaeon]